MNVTQKINRARAARNLPALGLGDFEAIYNARTTGSTLRPHFFDLLMPAPDGMFAEWPRLKRVTYARHNRERAEITQPLR